MAGSNMYIKKGDKVVVIAGADKSDSVHEVLSCNSETGRVLVKEVNMRWKHL